MAGEARVADLDPFDLLDTEAERVARFFENGPDWTKPTRCKGWEVRDLLAHLDAVETYHTACLDDRVQDFFEEQGKKGATDMDSFNALGVRERRELPVEEVLKSWRERNREVRRRMRESGRDGKMGSSVGPYPIGLMAFHVASEYATHGDDLAIDIPAAERDERTAWRTKVSEFAVEEAEKPLTFERTGDAYIVRSGGKEATLPAADFVEAVTARLPDDHTLDPELKDALRALA
jgi:uncharacterized protein (TIGR03083 family)